MRIKFWGVRGSVPCPGPDTVKYGGNTSCIELYIEQIGRRIIIDAGSGIRALGDELVNGNGTKQGINADIFITHTHWDHIMGFPFFAPLYLASTKLKIYGPVTHESIALEAVLSGQLTYRYFPVGHEELSASLSYVNLEEGAYDLGQGVMLKTKFLNHPLLCMGYRFEYNDKVICTAFDTEPFSNLFDLDSSDLGFNTMTANNGDGMAAEMSRHFEAFIRGADLLIYDAQYTQSEYETAKVGWGHSFIEHAIDVAKRNDVKHLTLFHHDVKRKDEQIDLLKQQFCCPQKNAYSCDISFAKEGMSIHI